MKIMKLTDIGSRPEDVAPYIADDDWIMQQKLDGARMQAIYMETPEEAVGTWTFTNDGVAPIKFAAALLVLPQLEAELEKWRQATAPGANQITFDGELIIETGTYHIFDVLEWHDWAARQQLITPEHSLAGRIAFLHGLGLEASWRPHVKLSPTAWTSDEKAAMWAAVQEAGVEGAVSKHLHSTYLPGARTKQWLKHKLVKDADVVVLNATRTFKPNGVVEKGSAVFGVYVGDKLKKIGAASLIGKDLTISRGDVVKIAYLYLGENGSPVQPRIIEKRDDKLPEECTWEQFPPYTRAIAWQAAAEKEAH